MKYLYKYPHAALSLRRDCAPQRERGRKDLEYELIDTGVFKDNRYFDVFVEYARSRRRTSSYRSASP